MSALAPTEAPSRWRQILIWLAFIGLDTGTQIAFKWGAEGLGDMDFGLEMLAKSVASVQGLIDACKTIDPSLA